RIDDAAAVRRVARAVVEAGLAGEGAGGTGAEVAFDDRHQVGVRPGGVEQLAAVRAEGRRVLVVRVLRGQPLGLAVRQALGPQAAHRVEHDAAPVRAGGDVADRVRG